MSYPMRPQSRVDTTHTPPRYSVNPVVVGAADNNNNTSTDNAFRNITSDSHNVYNISNNKNKKNPSTPGGFLSVKSSDHGAEEGLVSTLYGKIETQESELERLNFQYRQEKEQREKLEKEFASVREDAENTKKRFANYRKQERELRSKTHLDKKEREREDTNRWKSNHQEVEHLRTELAAKNQKLAEFESMCSNLQEALDKEKQRICQIYAKDMKEAERRLAVSTEMLQSCSAKLSKTDHELKEERKMKQILIKINEALQVEVFRLKEQQQQQYPDMLLSSNSTISSFRQMASKEDCDERTHNIIQDLQIEDALFYFEKVKKEYEDKPKVYRVFLEIIRDYKSRNSSTPEVIARISKLFSGNTKLIVGFNRFLPKDFHISEADVADMQSYRRKIMPTPEPAAEQTSPGRHLPASDEDVARLAASELDQEAVESDTEEVSKKEESKPMQTAEDATNSKTVVVARSSSTEPSKSVPKEMKNKERVKASEQGDKNKKSIQKKVKRKSKQSSSVGKKPPLTAKATVATKEEVLEPIDIAPKSSESELKAAGALLTASTSSSGDPIENLSISMLSTLSVSRKQSASSSIRYTTSHKSNQSGIMSNEDEESRQDAALLSAAEPPSPASQEVDTPRVQKFASFAMSSVDSSQVFGGIDTLEESLGDGLLPAMLSLDHHTLDQTTVVPDNDRYEVVVDGDDDCNAVEVEYTTGYQHNDSIEVIADSFMTGSFSRSYYSQHRKSSSSSPFYDSDSEWWDETDGRN